jgi:hypothetical protein
VVDVRVHIFLVSPQIVHLSKPHTAQRTRERLFAFVNSFCVPSKIVVKREHRIAFNACEKNCVLRASVHHEHFYSSEGRVARSAFEWTVDAYFLVHHFTMCKQIGGLFELPVANVAPVRRLLVRWVHSACRQLVDIILFALD